MPLLHITAKNIFSEINCKLFKNVWFYHFGEKSMSNFASLLCWVEYILKTDFRVW